MWQPGRQVYFWGEGADEGRERERKGSYSVYEVLSIT